MSDLDNFDMRILSLLQAEGDLTQGQISERVNLSPTQCGRRIARLRKEGYIQRFAAVLDLRRLGYTIVAHTLVSLRSHEDSANTSFRDFIARAPEVVECFAQTGDADYIVKIVCRDLDDLSEFLDRLIKAAGNLASLRSSIALKEIKKDHGLQAF
ncbi:Lrp/AsnC family transcriptional regulator [Frigidibacter sp. MR17.14]|uniref:Lrp/AsnC family transcriptional regulator n=1 Tax=Frigidibacter sp. MR17.14 TaxID=3126509 RepID=UPI003012AD18